MLSFVSNEEEKQNYLTFVGKLYELYHGRDGKYSNIQRALVLSALCGSVSREQILLTGMYGNYKRRHLPNADRLLSNNAEVINTKGRKYSKYFRKMPVEMRGNPRELPLYAVTAAGLHYMAKFYCTMHKENEMTEEQIYEFFRQHHSALSTRPVHAIHTDYSNDIATVAFTLCSDVPCYYKEMYICNPRMSAKPKDAFYISHDRDSDISLRSDAFLTLCGNWKESDRNISYVFYEQDTGSQRVDVMEKKANAYSKVFDTYLDTQPLSVQRPVPVFASTFPSFLSCGDCCDGAPPPKEKMHSATATLLFGLACVYDAGVQQDLEENGKITSEDASAPPFSSYRDKQAGKKLLEKLIFSQKLLGIPDLDAMERALKNASQRDKDFAEDYKLFLQIRRNFPDIHTLSEIDEKMSGAPASTTVSSIHDSRCHIEGFFKRRDFVFSAFRTSYYERVADAGIRVLAVPNQLMDVYFPFLFPDECGLYELCRKALLYMGYSFKKDFFSGPDSINGVVFPYTNTFELFSGDRLKVVYEHLSLDVTARMRIQSLLSHGSSLDHIILLCFFMSDELEAVREFALSLKDFPYYRIKADQRFTICFGCMEEIFEQMLPESNAPQKRINKAPSGSPCIFQLTEDGTAVYHTKPCPGKPSMCRMEVVSSDSKSVMEPHTFLDVDTLQYLGGTC